MTRSLTQVNAAAACCIKRSRWSDLERGVRTPTWRELRTISKFLNLGKVFVAPAGARKALLNQAVRGIPTPRPYFPTQDRLTHIRFCSCFRHYRELANVLLKRVMLREDFELCEYFCHKVACDSKLEAFHLLHLLQCGGVPCLLAPSSFGHTRWPIVSCDGRIEVGFRPRPCLILNGAYYFPQVSFATPQVYRVDVLCWQDGWSVLGINGGGHDSNLDRLRAITLDLPHTYVNEQQLLWLASRGIQKAG